MRILALLAAGLLCGCGSSARLESTATPAAGETVFVLGVAPDVWCRTS